jgi:hypothetical protein
VPYDTSRWYVRNYVRNYVFQREDHSKKASHVADTSYDIPRIYFWLVVWNMNFIFPYIGNSNPN